MLASGSTSDCSTSYLQAAVQASYSSYTFIISDIVIIVTMAVPSYKVPLGLPVTAHDLSDTARNGFYSVGANPPPAWSHCKIRGCT